MFSPINNSPKSDKSNSRSNSITSINSLRSNSSYDSAASELAAAFGDFDITSVDAVRSTPQPPSGRNINPREMNRSVNIVSEIGNKRTRDPSPEESLGSIEGLNINSDNSFSDNSTLPSTPDLNDAEYNDILTVLNETHYLPNSSEDSTKYFYAWIDTITQKEFIEGVDDNDLANAVINTLEEDKKMYERTLEQAGLSDEIKHKLQDRIEKLNDTIKIYEDLQQLNNPKRRRKGGKRKTRKNKFTAGDEETQYSSSELSNNTQLIGKYFSVSSKDHYLIDLRLGKFIGRSLDGRLEFEGRRFILPLESLIFKLIPSPQQPVRSIDGGRYTQYTRRGQKNKFTAGDEEKQYTFDQMVDILMFSDVRGPEKHFKSIVIDDDGTTLEETYLGKLTMLLDDKLIFENGTNITRIAGNESEQIRFVIVQPTNQPIIAAGRKRKTKKQFLFNPNDPKKSFDVYIDKNPKDTIPIKYTTVKDVEDTIKKLERLYKEGKYSHKRIWQVGMILKVRLAAMKKNQKKYYPKAKNVTKRLRLSEKYFKFLKKRTMEKDNKTRKNMKFKF